MHQILVYGDSLSWGIIPNTRERLEFSNAGLESWSMRCDSKNEMFA